ncbi:hypothetical protein J7E96_16005 [Streptomyces sp. ISL-96]|uniref:hypothetical protein n=1 Tax=Streptomyces sp. ISL-96 TaxID=2819191 RepID=UPI001BE75ADF|nr:hypothetical protein [Streptomyces sp. ISL-96]MBT2489993.1 hypothetical protein [Streptomyces sp. ISL-96]
MSAAVYCRCERLTLAPVAVRYIEPASGPGVTLYACPDCAPRLTPGPLPAETAPPRG